MVVVDFKLIGVSLCDWLYLLIWVEVAGFEVAEMSGNLIVTLSYISFWEFSTLIAFLIAYSM